MKSRWLSLFAVAVIAGSVGWYASSLRPHPTSAKAPTNERRVLYYQSSMHPWIKSDQPGKCTICGMDLVPVYEGESGFGNSSKLITLNSNQITVVNVQTVPVTRKPLDRTLRVAGTINDDDTRHRVLSAYTDGRLDRLFVNFVGAEVKEGQPLALVYSPTLLSAVREYVSLIQPSSTADAAGSKALRSAAASRLVQLGMTPSQIAALPPTLSETNLHVEIVAPQSGTVVSKSVFEGQTVTAGQPLMEIGDFTTMWFLFNVYEQDLADLHVGQPVVVSTPGLPGVTFTNAITFIDPNLNEATRSTVVRVEIPNSWVETTNGPQRQLRHRLSGTGKILLSTAPVLTVPRSAVLDSGQPVVFVELSTGTYQPRQVSLGRRGETEVEILSGLAEGERVVTEGALLLDAQAQLNVLSHANPSPTPALSPPKVGVPASTNLNAGQQSALRAFVKLADAVRESLAADSLTRFNELAPQMHEAGGALQKAFASEPTWDARVRELVAASHLDPAPDLATARREFHGLSVPLVGAVAALRTMPEFSGLKVFRCPMTKAAFPGAPARAEWIQPDGPVRNPYLGAEMLDCGTEVQP